MSASTKLTLKELLSEWNPEGRLVYEFALPIETPSNNQILRMNRFVYKQLRWDLRAIVKSQTKESYIGHPLARCFINIDRYSAGSLDWDNIKGGFKPLLDTFVVKTKKNPDGLGLIENDDISVVPYDILARQFPAKPKEGKTVVRIYELSN